MGSSFRDAFWGNNCQHHGVSCCRRMFDWCAVGFSAWARPELQTVLESPELISLIRCDFHVVLGGLGNQPIDSFRQECEMKKVPWKEAKLSSVDQMNMNMNLLSEGVIRQVCRSSWFLFFPPSVLVFVDASEFCCSFRGISWFCRILVTVFPNCKSTQSKTKGQIKQPTQDGKTESIFQISDRKTSICHRPQCFSGIERVSKTYGLFVLRHALVTRDLIKTCCLWLEPLQSAITHHYLWPPQPLEQ